MRRAGIGLPPCPFCGGGDLGVYIREDAARGQMNAHVWCRGCRAAGPMAVLAAMDFGASERRVAVEDARRAWRDGLEREDNDEVVE